MFEIQCNSIKITKGDTGRAKLTIYNKDGSIYEPTANDVIQFSVKKFFRQETPFIQKSIRNQELVIEPSDTSELRLGDYIFDIQIILSNGDIQTIISGGKLTIMGEVSV